MPKPHIPVLSSMLAEWTANGWPLEDFHAFRLQADGDGDGDDGSGGDAGGDDAEGDGGDGVDGDDSTDWKSEAERLAAEAEKWKTLSRKHESRAKANADKAKKYDESDLTDAEKLAAEAEERGRTAALAETGRRLAAAEVRAALAGIVPDPKSIVEDLDLSRYVADDGEVDEDAVTALRDKYASLAKPGRPKGSADGGNRGGDKPKRATSLEAAVQKSYSTKE